MDLLKKENFLQLVLNTIPIYVFWKDRNSIYLGCNQNFATSAKLQLPDDIVGKSDYDLPWSKEDSDFYRKIDKEVMDSNVPQINFEESQTIGNGETRWLRTSKIPMHDADNQVIGILGTYEDITVKKKMEIQLKQQAKQLTHQNEHLKKANFKLEQMNIDLEQFAYATSHDLQEPLRMIGGFISLLSNKYQPILDQDGIDYINYIKNGANRMSSMIQSLLSYSKLEDSSTNFEPVDFKVIIQKTLETLQPTIHKKKAIIKVNLPSQKIKCQPVRMSLLFSNLISNGLKFNQSCVPEIHITHRELDSHWEFTVSDNGIGISDEYKDYIFKPFKRLHTRVIYPGDGIGLSICKRVINIHDGEIGYTTNKLGGTDIVFSIRK